MATITTKKLHQLLALPAEFTYASFGWTGDPLADGTPTPGGHDGMACFGSARVPPALVTSAIDLSMSGISMVPT